MEDASFLKDALIILIAAVAVVSLFRGINISPILGYLLAGALIGPHGFLFIEEIEGTVVLGKLGVVFLLFTIGLKMPLQRLQVLRRYVFGLGFAQVLVTGTLFASIAYYLGLSLEASILAGSGLALSSTAVGVQLLSERGEIAMRFGRVSFAILLFQDLAVVVLLMLLSTFKGEGTPIFELLGIATLKAAIVLFFIIIVGRVLLKPFYRGISAIGSQELFVAVNLLVILITSFATAAAGLSMELGAFLAGILLSETEYRHQVEADIQPFYGLLIGLFFMTVGMTLDYTMILDKFGIILGLLISMLIVKSTLLFTLARVFRIPLISALRVALLLASGGEFVFVLFIPAVDANIIPPEISNLLITIVALSMGFTPFLAMLGKWLDDRFVERQEDKYLEGSMEEVSDLRNHVIIAGFGRVGHMVAKMLTDRMVPYVAIDNNMDAVAKGRAEGIPVFYGDVRRPEVLRVLGAQKAAAAVVSLNMPKSCVRTAMMLRKQFPNILVAVRMRDDGYYEKLTQAGAIVVMPENLEPSLQLAAKVLNAVGTPHDEIQQVIETFRRSYSDDPTLEVLAREREEDDEDEETLPKKAEA